MKYLIAAALTVMMATGCATSQPTKQTADDASPPTVSADTTPPAVEEEPTETPTFVEPEDTIAKIGPTQWFTYEDGLQVQVTKLTKFRVSQYAAGAKPGSIGVMVHVTIRNKTGRAFDAALASVNLSYGPNGDTANDIYDGDATGIGFEGSIANGKAKTARFGFGVPAKWWGQIDVEVAPSWEHNGAHFAGALE